MENKEEYKKEYKKYLISAILDNANNKIASASFMIAFGVYLGISDFWLGVYTIIGTVTNIFQIFAAPIFSRIGQSKKVVLTNYSLYRISSVLPVFIPFITQDIQIRTILFLIYTITYAITGNLGYITFVNWRMTLVTKEDVPKYVATKNMFKNTIVVGFSLLMGVLLDTFTNQGNQLMGFLILFVLVAVIAMIDIFIRTRTYKPKVKEEKVTIIDTIKIPMKDKNFRKILSFCGIYKLAIGFGTMYLNIYILKYLNVDYTFYSILNVCTYLANALFGVIWAKLYKRFSKWQVVIIPILLIHILSFSMLLFGSTYILFLLPIIYILIGIADSGYELFDNIAIYENSKEGHQTSYVTFERFIGGVVTAFIPFIASVMFTNEESVGNVKTTFSIAIVILVVNIAIYVLGRKSIKSKIDK